MAKIDLIQNMVNLFTSDISLVAANTDFTAVASLAKQTADQPFCAAGDQVRIEAGERFGILGSVAIVPIRGLLTPNMAFYERYFGWTTYHGLAETCAILRGDEDIAAVIVDTDSPGGMVLGLEGAAQALAALAAEKPVHVIADPMAASAAYWLSSQGGEISVAPGAEVGSIGVMQRAAWPVQPGGHGYQESIVTSSHAAAKLPNPETDEGMAEIKRQLDEIEAQFHAAVASGRGISVDELLTRAGVDGDPKRGGAMFSADRAVEVGLADHVETRADFYGRILAKYRPQQAAKRGAGAQRQAQIAAAVAQT